MSQLVAGPTVSVSITVTLTSYDPKCSAFFQHEGPDCRDSKRATMLRVSGQGSSAGGGGQVNKLHIV